MWPRLLCFLLPWAAPLHRSHCRLERQQCSFLDPHCSPGMEIHSHTPPSYSGFMRLLRAAISSRSPRAAASDGHLVWPHLAVTLCGLTLRSPCVAVFLSLPYGHSNALVRRSDILVLRYLHGDILMLQYSRGLAIPSCMVPLCGNTLNTLVVVR